MSVITASEMISTLHLVLADLFDEDSVESIADYVIALHALEKLPSLSDMNTPTALLYYFLKYQSLVLYFQR